MFYDFINGESALLNCLPLQFSKVNFGKVNFAKLVRLYKLLAFQIKSLQYLMIDKYWSFPKPKTKESKVNLFYFIGLSPFRLRTNN